MSKILYLVVVCVEFQDGQRGLVIEKITDSLSMAELVKETYKRIDIDTEIINIEVVEELPLYLIEGKHLDTSHILKFDITNFDDDANAQCDELDIQHPYFEFDYREMSVNEILTLPKFVEAMNRGVKGANDE